jgi:hypothetical protein
LSSRCCKDFDKAFCNWSGQPISRTVLFSGHGWKVGLDVIDLVFSSTDALELLDFDFQPPLEPARSTKHQAGWTCVPGKRGDDRGNVKIQGFVFNACPAVSFPVALRRNAIKLSSLSQPFAYFPWRYVLKFDPIESSQFYNISGPTVRSMWFIPECQHPDYAVCRISAWPAIPLKLPKRSPIKFALRVMRSLVKCGITCLLILLEPKFLSPRVTIMEAVTTAGKQW